MNEVSPQIFGRKNHIFAALERSGYTIQDLLPAFPGESEELVRQRLDDNALRYRRTVERFGYLGTRECVSKFFNVVSGRFRRSPRAPVVNASETGHIHCYGGSTTAGHNVGDDETYPHYLEEILRTEDSSVRVLNFGAGNHTNLHSSLHLLDHCLSGRIPKVALMLNGLNDMIYINSSSDGALEFLDTALFLSQHSPGQNTPIGEISGLMPKLGLGTQNEPTGTELPDGDVTMLASALEELRHRMCAALAIRDFCSAQWGVKVLNYWEPTPYLHCTSEQDPLRLLRSNNPALAHVEKLAEATSSAWLGEIFGIDVICNLSDCGQSSLSGQLYVDEFHGSPLMNQQIARVVAEHLGHLGTVTSLSHQVSGAPKVGGRAARPDRKVRETSRHAPQKPDLYPLW